MARVNMMKTIVSDRRQPHSPLDNVNTPYNPIRLLKGAPPGQEAVNHYISELSIEKKNNTKLSDKERKHLVMLEVRGDIRITESISPFQACDDEYQYHYKLFGQGAGADRDMKFYAPQLVKDYVNQIRRFWDISDTSQSDFYWSSASHQILFWLTKSFLWTCLSLLCLVKFISRGSVNIMNEFSAQQKVQLDLIQLYNRLMD